MLREPVSHSQGSGKDAGDLDGERHGTAPDCLISYPPQAVTVKTGSLFSLCPMSCEGVLSG